jgi:type I restriction enzyme, S subunit
MSRYKFEDIAFNITKKRKPTTDDMQTYIGLEHLDSGSLSVTCWGSNVPIKGDKLIMQAGDVLFGKRNAYLRRASIAPHDGLFSAHGMVLKPNEKIISKALFPFFVCSDYFFDAAIRISVGSLSPTINWSALKELEFNLPDMKEQEKLAELLWAANDTKESYKKLLSLTDDLVKSQFIEMFGDSIKNDKCWPYKKLPEVTTIVLGSTPKTSIDEYWDGDIKWVTPAELSDDAYLINDTVRHISEIGAKSAGLKAFPAGTVLLSSRAPIGKTAITTCEMYCNQGFKNFICSEELHPIYLYCAFRYNKDYLISLGSGTTFKEISKSVVEKIAISIPPIELQEQYSELFQQADKSKLELQQAISSLENTVKSLLKQYIG